MLRGGEGAAWCKLGEHQFMAIFEVDKLQPDRMKHFGLMVRDAKQIKKSARSSPRSTNLNCCPAFVATSAIHGAIASRWATSATNRWSGCFLIRRCRRPASSSEGELMKAHYLGHVVFYVKDLERSLAFYRDLLGFQEVGRHSMAPLPRSRQVARITNCC